MNLRIVLTALLTASLAAAAGSPPRPPSVPLATHSPYFCLWSPGDRLTDQATTHWTGRPQPLSGLLRVDGQIYRVMGDQPSRFAPLPQTSLQLMPTRSIYVFENAQVRVRLTFTDPLLFDDLDVLARPVTYVTWEVRTLDGKAHAMDVLLAAGGELAVNEPSQEVTWTREQVPGLACARIGTPGQPVLATRGDDRRIDWGYAYLAGARANVYTGPYATAVAGFEATGTLPLGDEGTKPRRVNDGQPAMALVQHLGKVKRASATQLLAYDEVKSVEYFGTQLKPYWKRRGATMAQVLQAAARDSRPLARRCEAFDKELMADAEHLGGPDYAYLCALAYRQAIAGNGLAADAQGAPLLFPKENFSNGCISTVDVIYPEAPLLLLFSPTLAKALLVPPAAYGASPSWPYAYAPHDLGQYPKANGQVYGMDGTDADRMPVEESGNLLLLFGALAHVEGQARFAEPFWSHLHAWATYLERQGFDPDNQLCTDDFAGHLAHNANLSLKAILALAAYGRLCDLRGDAAEAAHYRTQAEAFAKRWVKAADDGDHYRLAFDQPGTWSQKYNLVWDKILGLNVFPPEVAEKEMAFYARKLNPYGLPLDSRKTYAKADWSVWTATLRGGRREDLERLLNPLYDAFNTTPQRVPFTDHYETTDATQVQFQARPVVGGIFLPFLTNPKLWAKWSGRGKGRTVPLRWAPLPSRTAPRASMH